MAEESIYKLGEKLGLNSKDINTVLEKRTASDKPVSLSLRVDSYPKGTHYGTVSIKDF